MKTAAEPGGEIRCPACARLLVLRSGPKVAPHYAHRPRQSCRNRPGRAAPARLRLEQLTLFELPPPALPSFAPAPVESAPVELAPVELAPVELPAVDAGPSPLPSVRRARRRRRHRRAWLPRLVRWLKRGHGLASPGLHP